MAPALWRSLTCADLPGYAASTYGEHSILRRRVSGAWYDITGSQYASDVDHVVKGLIASGLAPGDRVLIVARPSYETCVVMTACWGAGLCVIPIDHDTHIEHLGIIVKDAAPVAAFTDNGSIGDFLIASAGDVFANGRLWLYRTTSGAATVEQLVARGSTLPGEYEPPAVPPDSDAVILYSRGVTYRPQGAILTHANLLHATHASITALNPVATDRSFITLVSLPLDDIAVILALVRATLSGVPTAFTHTGAALAQADEVSPVVIVSTPWLLQRVVMAASNRLHAAGKGKLFTDAKAAALEASLAGAKDLRKVTEGTVLARLGDAFGGRLRWFLSTGAPCPIDVAHLYNALGITVLEGYGPRETCGVATLNRPHDVVFGTYGTPVEELEVFIGELGDISVRGPQIFRGYADEATTLRRSVDAGGWYTTGDTGTWEDGRLKVTGRTREAIVTASGHMVNPLYIEDMLRQHELIGHAVVVGEGRAGIGVLLTMNHDAVLAWLASQERDDLTLEQMAHDPALNSEMRTLIESVNETLAVHERITRMKILPVELSYEKRHLTETLKIRRRRVLEDFSTEIDHMYGSLDAN